MPTDINPQEFAGLFETFVHSAWRLEVRGRYASDEDDPAYGQWLRGETPQWDLTTPYARTIRHQIGGGARVERARILDTPPTTGQLYLLAHGQKNELLGEDVRCLSRSSAHRLNLPNADFWIFDDRQVALLHFDDEDCLLGATVIEEPDGVGRYRRAGALARRHAIPYRAYAIPRRVCADPGRPRGL